MKTFSHFCMLAVGLVSSVAITSCKTVKQTSEVHPERSIVVLYDNDVHCNIEGYAKYAGLRDAISDTAYVAMVSNGDYLQGGTAGAISHGQYVVDVMKHMKYDAVTLGNHEFDYYVPRMFELLGQLGAPVVCANFRDMNGKAQFAPYVIKEYGGRKVAFVGVVTPTALYTEAYSFFDKDDKQLYNLSENEVYSLVQQAVDEARGKGADYVVVLSHLGEDKNTTNADSHGLVKATTGIDVLLDGHTHNAISSTRIRNKEGKVVLVSQTGTKFENVGKLVIRPDGKITTELVPMKSVTYVNQEVKAVTDSVLTIMNELVNRPVCDSEVKLVILDDKGYQEVRKAETNAGDIVADAYRIMTGADFAITNGGGIRAEVNAGKLTYGDMVSLLPYDNYVSVVEVTGAELVELLKACTQFLPVTNGDFPQVSGMKFTINVGSGEQISDLVILNKSTGNYEPVVLDKTYQLATIDYCITGGGLQGKLKKNNIVKPNIMIYNECLIQYVTEKLKGHIGQEYAKPQGRITIKY